MTAISIASRANLRDSLSQFYLEDPRPWLVGFSGGKDSTMLAALIFDAVLSIHSAIH
jgi:DNA sulfur modification protein DndC